MQTKKMAAALTALALGVATPAFGKGSAATGDQKSSQEAGQKHGLVKEADATVAAFRKADPDLSRFFDGAVGWAVFPSVGKGAVGIGGAYGRGVLFEHGKALGETSLTQVTVGAQLGGEAYSEVVFFESPGSLAAFKKGQFAMAAEVSAVVAATGAAANARYAQGVAVFTLPKGGLMAEASVGGQKFGYTPFARAM